MTKIVGTKFHFKQTTLNFGTKFARKWLKTEKCHFCVRPLSLLTTLNFSEWESTNTTACLFNFFSLSSRKDNNKEISDLKI